MSHFHPRDQELNKWMITRLVLLLGLIVEGNSGSTSMSGRGTVSQKICKDWYIQRAHPMRNI